GKCHLCLRNKLSPFNQEGQRLTGPFLTRSCYWSRVMHFRSAARWPDDLRAPAVMLAGGPGVRVTQPLLHPGLNVSGRITTRCSCSLGAGTRAVMTRG